MLHILIAIAGILLTIFFVIGTHEFAHFAMARLLGVKVIRFSIGFGKKLLHWHDKKGTEYVLALIPLGGYVKMLDESEGKVAPTELPFAFNHQPYYKRILIILAGPAMNILCAWVLYATIFMVGFVTLRPIIGEVQPNSIAANAGLKPKQEIIALDQRPTSGWPSILFRILAHAGDKDKLQIEVKSANQTSTHSLDLATWQLDSLNPQPLASLGIQPYEPEIPLTISIITPDSPAAKAGLKVGDKLVMLDKKPIKNWQELITTFSQNPEKSYTLSIERQGKLISIPITTGYKQNWLGHKTGYVGIAPLITLPKDLLNKVQYGPVQAFKHAWQQMVDLTYFNLLLLGKMLIGKISIQSLGGPLTIFESAGSALNYGFLSFLSFLAFLSISIGVINLLPIPGLDGGHLFIYVIEMIIRRPLPERVLDIFYRLGFVLIIFFLLQALLNDMLRLY